MKNITVIVLLLSLNMVSGTIDIPRVKNSACDIAVKGLCKNFRKSALQGVNQSSSCYTEFVNTYVMNEFDKAEQDSYRAGDDKMRRQIVDEKFRHNVAYGWCNPEFKFSYNLQGEVEIDSATLHEIGIDKLLSRVPNRLIMGESSLAAQFCTPTTNDRIIKIAQDRQKLFEEDEQLRQELESFLQDSIVGERALLDLWNSDKAKTSKRVMSSYRLDLPLARDSASMGNAKAYLGVLRSVASHMFNRNATTYYKKMGINSDTIATLDKISFGADMKRALEVVVNGLEELERYPMRGYFSVLLGTVSWITPFLPVGDDVKKNIIYGSDIGALCLNAHAHYCHRSSEQEAAVHQSLIDVAGSFGAAEKIYTGLTHEYHQRSHPEMIIAILES